MLLHLFRSIFASPLEKLAYSVAVMNKDKSRAASAFESINQKIIDYSTQGTLPYFVPTPTILVGSHLRGSDLHPLREIDMYLCISGEHVLFNETSSTVQLADQNDTLFAVANQDRMIQPETLFGIISQAFSVEHRVKYTHHLIGVAVFVESVQVWVNIIPALTHGNETYLVPIGHHHPGWRKASPILEKQKIDELDALHNGLLKKTIVLAQLWNEESNQLDLSSYMIEIVAVHIFMKFDTPATSLHQTVTQYFKQLPHFFTNCPDLFGYLPPLHVYTAINIDRWYIVMNRIDTFRKVIMEGEEAMVRFLRHQEKERAS